jgi:23S rRNA (adenine2030-N6)-methyltransferase
MKYRHSYHAGNFADVHKHVTLLAVLEALKRKDKGFLYLETHAGRGSYKPAGQAEARLGIERFTAATHQAEELRAYSNAIADFRKWQGDPQAYPGSPVLAAQALRPQDRGVFIEIQPAESRALERALPGHSNSRVECDDGFTRLRAHLPPPERRGLTFIDPPYEETHRDFEQINAAIGEALRKFATGVIAVWYPIKDARDTAAWHASVVRLLQTEALVSELWLYPRDSRVALNGSGLLIVNPPYQLGEQMQRWLPELHAALDPDKAGGWESRGLSPLAR